MATTSFKMTPVWIIRVWVGQFAGSDKHIVLTEFGMFLGRSAGMCFASSHVGICLASKFCSFSGLSLFFVLLQHSFQTFFEHSPEQLVKARALNSGNTSARTPIEDRTSNISNFWTGSLFQNVCKTLKAHVWGSRYPQRDSVPKKTWTIMPEKVGHHQGLQIL